MCPQFWRLGTPEFKEVKSVADILFGDFNPGGRLPATFPRTVGQVPIYYNFKSTGRPSSAERWSTKYIDLPYTPLFPFGHGLSYTLFEYSNLRTTPETIKPDGKIKVFVDVQNVGD